MSGKRKEQTDLPPRVYLQRGVYFYVSHNTEKWIRLGTDKATAIQRIAQGRELASVPLERLVMPLFETENER